MANLSNINNKLIVTDGGNLLVNATANLATYGGITINNFSDPSIAMKTTSASGWLWTQYITNTGTNNFSMGVNQSIPYWCVKAGAGMDSPHLVVNSSGNVGIGTITPSSFSGYTNLSLKAGSTGNNLDFFNSAGTRIGAIVTDGSDDVILEASGLSRNLIFKTDNAGTLTERMRITSAGDVLIHGAYNPYSQANRGNITLNGSNSNIIAFTNNSSGKAYIYHNGLDFEITNGVAGVLKFATNSTERMRIDGSGNVGIGITSGIDANLRVDANSATLTQEILKVKGGGSGGAYGFLVEANNGDDLFKVNTLSYDSYFPNGKVGIGTTNPGYTFTVNKSITNDWLALFGNTYDGAGNGMLIDAGNGSNGEILRLRDKDGNNKVHFLSNGNVGIGTGGPPSKLTVMESTLCTNSGSDGGTSYVPAKPILLVTTDGNGTPSSFYATNSVFTVGIGGGITGGVTTEHLRVNLNGNVGIGTNSPQGKLDSVAPVADLTDFGRATGSALNIRIGNVIGYLGQINFCNDAAPAFGYGSIGMVMTSGSGVGLADMVFGTKSSGAAAVSTERMRITSSGNTLLYNSLIFSDSSYVSDYSIRRNANALIFSGGSDGFFFNRDNNSVTDMWISGDGITRIGGTANLGYDSHNIQLSAASSYALIVRNSDTSTTNSSVMQFNRAETTATTQGYCVIYRQGDAATGTNRWIVFANGNIQNTNNSYGSLSDERKKENIVDATPKLDDLMKVKVRNFNLKGEKIKQIGVVAQELEEVFPGMIDESKIPDSEDETLYKGVKYSVFVPMLIKAIQELKAEIELLKSK